MYPSPEGLRAREALVMTLHLKSKLLQAKIIITRRNYSVDFIYFNLNCEKKKQSCLISLIASAFYKAFEEI